MRHSAATSSSIRLFSGLFYGSFPHAAKRHLQLTGADRRITSCRSHSDVSGSHISLLVTRIAGRRATGRGSMRSRGPSSLSPSLPARLCFPDSGPCDEAKMGDVVFVAVWSRPWGGVLCLPAGRTLGAAGQKRRGADDGGRSYRNASFGSDG